MKKRRKKIIVKLIFLLELVMALAILAFIAVAFHSLNLSIQRYDKHLENQTEALSVMDNFLERLSALKTPNAKDAEKIFRMEFERNSLKNKKALSAFFQEKDNVFFVYIKNAEGKILASVELKKISYEEGEKQ